MAKSLTFKFDEELFNPVFLPQINATESIQLLTGNRGSGKSVFKHQKALIYALTKNYFRLGYGRKVADTVRDSMFQGFKDLITEWELHKYFQVKEGAMDIICKINGNMLLSFGLDDPDKLKALKDLSHVFVDEMTGITFEDYANLSALLRTSKARYKQFWGLFNPEFDFWGRQYFFLDADNDIIPLGIVPAKTGDTLIFKATFKQNPFIDPVTYEAKLRELARGNKNYLTVWVDGNWGEAVTGNEYFPEFSRVIHVKPVPFLKGKPIHNTYDFNVVPFMTEICNQVNVTETEFQIRVFKEYCLSSPLNSTKSACNAFIDDYRDRITDLFYYGDASGQSRIAGKGNETAFDDVEEYLGLYLNNSSKRVMKRNPSVLKRRDFMNDLLAGKVYYNGLQVILMIDEACKETIEDMTKLKLGIDGKMKERVTDKVKGITYEKRSHTSDALEYFIIRLLWDLFNKD